MGRRGPENLDILGFPVEIALVFGLFAVFVEFQLDGGGLFHPDFLFRSGQLPRHVHDVGAVSHEEYRVNAVGQGVHQEFEGLDVEALVEERRRGACFGVHPPADDVGGLCRADGFGRVNAADLGVKRGEPLGENLRPDLALFMQRPVLVGAVPEFLLQRLRVADEYDFHR
jgi:hypothetical protein